MYNKIFPPKKIALPNGKIVLEKRSKAPLILLIVMIAVYYSAQVTGFSFEVIIKRIHEFFTIILEMLKPNWKYFDDIIPELLVTLKMSFFGSVVGAIVALPAAVLASTNIIKIRVIDSIFKTVLSLLRTMPTLVTALIATYVFDLPATAGTIAIFLFTISYVGKLLYEAIENADMDSFEAMESIGMTRIQAFRYAIMPQVLPGYLSTSLFCFEGNVRYAAILGYVGAGGIGNLINETIGWRDYSSLGMIVIMLVITVYTIETISEHFRKKLI
ncbi:phosphonate ABC transporter, permease protein PhnE [Aquibacillus rhizosphaerae]|uniref:Phosphonate ABC transporter, permease protein PhnE n=1 Tax=Aquibacillus rhizosphaerae TaxID=3051431 RepID=A0ABT7L3V2_9BACI|nr:phosphonate ABC transporter, permease protein PhnE [Aquibacillus sp. LR5S19]MDL4840537.1 phosphonate ABC transporter, permease protein PhnE [Aquibacillus sp. LR5S19]